MRTLPPHRAGLMVVIALAGNLVAATRGVAQNNLPDSIARRIDAVFTRFTPSAPGCEVGVYQDARIVFANGYGSANIEYAIPLTPQTPMIMGSVSKQFTASTIALLVEQHRISLSDDIRRYVPELKDYGKTVTIDNLVHHTSGIRDFWALNSAAGVRLDDGYTVDDILAIAARQKRLNFDPGSEYAYSNTGYVLLGIVVQRVTGKSLRQFADEQIFAPLGMTHTHYHDDHNEPVMGRAFAYEPTREGGWKIDVWNNDIVGQGGLMTTVEDLQKWDENFYTGTVGGPSFLARQLEQGRLSNGTTLAYAFGLEVGSYRGLPMVEHSGSTGGYRTDITRFPTAHTTVVTMCNASTAGSVGLAHQVADVVLGGRFSQPAPAPPGRVTAPAATVAANVHVSVAELSVLAGQYYSQELNATWELTVSGGSLLLHRPRATVDTLRAIDHQTFRADGYTLRFKLVGRSSAPSFNLDFARVRGLEFARAATESPTRPRSPKSPPRQLR